MAENREDRVALALLEFLTPSDASLSILAVEAPSCLAPLRMYFPNAKMHAVTAAPITDRAVPGLGAMDVTTHTLDYHDVPLPFPKASFDILLAPDFLTTVVNPQDMASGFGTFLKPTGFLLTSFENIRYYRVLELLMDGHYMALMRRLFARAEYVTLMAASFYKDLALMPLKEGTIPAALAARFAAASFRDTEDMETKTWLVQAWRSSRAVGRLKAFGTPEMRRVLVTLCRRLEYGIDTAENRAMLRIFCAEEGITPVYFAAFTRETIVHRAAFRAALAAGVAEDWVPYLDVLDETWCVDAAEENAEIDCTVGKEVLSRERYSGISGEACDV